MVFSLLQQSSQALQRYIPSQVIAVVAEPEQQINNSLVISTVFFWDKKKLTLKEGENGLESDRILIFLFFSF